MLLPANNSLIKPDPESQRVGAETRGVLEMLTLQRREKRPSVAISSRAYEKESTKFFFSFQ